MKHCIAPIAWGHACRGLISAAAIVFLLGSSPAAWCQDGSLLSAPRQRPEAPPRVVDRGLRQATALAARPVLSPPPQSPRGSAAATDSPANPYAQPNISLSEASWTYVPPAAVRTYQKNDIVTIRVDELSRMQAEGNAENRRNALYDAILKDWITLDGLDEVRPAPQANGDPRVQGTLNQLYRADSSIESRESLSFNIAARIVDIRPNGDLVLEAQKTIVFNENVWETELSGVCRPADIAPDNVVLSRDLLDLQIHRQDRGRLRDGYRRGWFTRWFETLSPF